LNTSLIKKALGTLFIAGDRGGVIPTDPAELNRPLPECLKAFAVSAIF